MTDGRVLIGVFLCTDRDRNLILGNASEYIITPSKSPFPVQEAYDETESGSPNQEGRVLGLAMVPGQHVVSVKVESIN